MDLRCKNCNSTDLIKLSLAYEKGLFRPNAQSPVQAAVLGKVGSLLPGGMNPLALSKALAPPVQRTYTKVILWSAIVLVFGGLLVFYVTSVRTKSHIIVWRPTTFFVLISGCVFVVLLFRIWWHNVRVYPPLYAEWHRCFVCQRCGTVVESTKEIMKASNFNQVRRQGTDVAPLK